MTPLDPKTWERVRVIFREIADLPDAERHAHLDRRCENEPALRAEVESLLRADHDAGAFLETPAGEYAAVLIDEMDSEAEELPEQGRIPPYVLRRLIGRGGMGSVYLAERDDGQFEQEVALKLIARDRNTSEIAQRFLRERQILAGLTHPNIARLLDGGVTSAGRPYFAMEYVDGEPITRWVRENELDIDPRLRLFEDVCAAVEYAQQRLVVHRDLKPSNILVDREGRVKLLDFGIAKLLDDTPGAGDTITADAAKLMTPEYAAPEQLHNQPVSTATDVYALGAVLYELLSGQRPHGSGALEVFRKRLRDPETAPLSRAVEVGSLRRRLSGDLENIVSKATAVEPEHRYGTAGALLEDLRRYRAGEPVSAVAPSWPYRARKFVRRNAWGVGLAATVLVLLMAGLGAVSWQIRATTREAARAEQVKSLLIDVFTARDPVQSRGADPPASELLARGAARVRDELSHDPGLRAEMLGILGNIHEGLGQYEAARQLHTDALNTRIENEGPDHFLVAKSLVSLSEVAIHQSHFTRAESLMVRALPIVRSNASDQPALLSATLSNMAAALSNLERNDEAEPYHREVVAHDRIHYGDTSPEVALDLSNLGVFLTGLGNYEEALASYEEALAMRREILDSGHPDIAVSLHNLGDVYQRSGRLEESEQAFREAIALRRQNFQGAHPKLANSIRSLGMTLQDAGDHEAAEAAYLEAYEMSRTLLGDVHETVALALNSLGAVAFYRGDLDVSTERFKESLSIFQQLLPETHSTVQTLRGNIATLEVRRGNYEGAETAYRQILPIIRGQLGDEHPNTANGARNIGIALRLRGQPSAALPWLEEALAVYLKLHGTDHIETALTISRMADALCDLKRFEEAETLLRDAIAGLYRMFPDGHRRLGDAHRVLGRVLLESGRPRQALPALQEAVAQFEEQVGAEHDDATMARCQLARCLLALGRTKEARPLLRNGLAKLEASQPAHHPDMVTLKREFANLPSDG